MRNNPAQIYTFRKIGMASKVKSVSKIWVRMSTSNVHSLELKFKVTCKNTDLNAGYQDSYQRETIQYLQHYIRHFAFFSVKKIIKNKKIQPGGHLCTLESTNFDERIKCTLRLLILAPIMQSVQSLSISSGLLKHNPFGPP